MDDPLLFKVAVTVFALLLLGLVLTIYEFKTYIMPKQKNNKTKEKQQGKASFGVGVQGSEMLVGSRKMIAALGRRTLANPFMHTAGYHTTQ